jgi:nucleoside-diphosphate-sugar epimerase
VSFIDVRDVAAAAVETLTGVGHEGQAYTLTGSEALTYHDAARLLSAAAGRTITYTPISQEDATTQRRDAEQPAFVVEIGATMDAFGRRDGFARIADTFTRLAGRPPVRFTQFARDAAADPAAQGSQGGGQHPGGRLHVARR